MIKIHIVVGDNAATALNAAFATIENFEDTIFVVKDVFNVGPLKSETVPFSQNRAQFWNEVSQVENIEVDDLERLMEVSTQLSNENVHQVWFWMSGIPADVCTYFWLLHFLKKHIGKLYVVNINGLPFLDDEGKLFYPESIAHLPQRQVLKAFKLSRAVTPSEWETDGDEWKRLINELDVGIRINSGGKNIVGKSIDFYDKFLLETAATSNQKIAKLLNTVMQKNKIFTGDSFLIWRLRLLAEMQKVSITKDSVKLFDGVPSVEMFDDTKTDNGNG